MKPGSKAQFLMGRTDRRKNHASHVNRTGSACAFTFGRGAGSSYRRLERVRPASRRSADGEGRRCFPAGRRLVTASEARLAARRPGGSGRRGLGWGPAAAGKGSSEGRRMACGRRRGAGDDDVVRSSEQTNVSIGGPTFVHIGGPKLNGLLLRPCALQ